MLVAFAITACHVVPPNPPDFGYARASDGSLVVAYPLCPGDRVTGAEIAVLDDGFTTLWKATGPRSPDVGQGLFAIGDNTAFAQEVHPLRGALPEGFYVSVFEVVNGKAVDGRDGWIDLSRLRNIHLDAGEFMTHTGKVMTRADINAQLPCPEHKS
ncbi:hypothetical protein [Streptomyces sp. NPDC003635]